MLSDVAKGCIDVLLTYLTALVPAYATVLLASGKGFSASGFLHAGICAHLCSGMAYKAGAHTGNSSVSGA